MENNLITAGIWKTLTSAAKKSRNPAYVAVAYFGRGASKLLPLRANSRLVVDASDGAVKSGQTCPADLKKMQKRGVIIYSLPNLHAKIYAFDKIVFIGSANASNHAAKILIEIMVSTSDANILRDARHFIRERCLDELTPGRLDRLQKQYRPPHMFGTAKPHQTNHLKLPRLLIAQTHYDDLPDGAEKARDDGLKAAKRKQTHKRYDVETFWFDGTGPYRERDKLVEVAEENRKRLVSPPGEIVHTRRWSNGKRHLTFVYYEYPNVRRIRLERLARRLGYGAKKKLSKDGLVRNRNFAEKLLAAFGG